MEHFRGHYENWIKKRVLTIREHYGDEWFKGKKVLELGSGYAYIGYEFQKLGATVTCLEAREGHIREAKMRFPNNEYIQVDLNQDVWGVEGRTFDLVLNLGTLYHLENPEHCLRKCYELSDNIVIDTETIDTAKSIIKTVKEVNEYDQSFTTIGHRTSPSYMEKLLEFIGYDYIRLMDDRANHEIHMYDWKINETKESGPEHRRFWFCAKKGPSEFEITPMRTT